MSTQSLRPNGGYLNNSSYFSYFQVIRNVISYCLKIILVLYYTRIFYFLLLYMENQFSFKILVFFTIFLHIPSLIYLDIHHNLKAILRMCTSKALLSLSHTFQNKIYFILSFFSPHLKSLLIYFHF